MRKTTLEPHKSCCVRKTAAKSILYLKNDNISKVVKTGHHPKAIAFAKSPLWVKNKNCQNHAKNNSGTT